MSHSFISQIFVKLLFGVYLSTVTSGPIRSFSDVQFSENRSFPSIPSSKPYSDALALSQMTIVHYLSINIAGIGMGYSGYRPTNSMLQIWLIQISKEFSTNEIELSPENFIQLSADSFN